MYNRLWSARSPLVIIIFGTLIIIIIGFWLFDAGWSRGKSIGEQEANADNYASEADRQIEERCFNGPPDSLALCIREVIETTNEHKRAERDLVAQIDAAFWGSAVLVVSVVGTALGVVGTFLIYGTLAATRDTVQEARRATRAAEDSVREARNATKAAQESVGVARQIGKAQVRAYVSVLEYNGEMHRPQIQVGTLCSISFVIKNNGNSPARRLRYAAQLIIASPSFAIDDFPLMRPPTHQPPEALLGGGETIFGFATLEEPLSDLDFSEMTKSEPQRRLFLYGVVDYTDVFARDSTEMHFTQFCSEIRVTRMEEGGAKKLKIIYVKTARHNYAT